MKMTVRKNGTKVYKTETNQDKIDALRSIVTEGQYAVINGQMIDLFSASAIIAVYDALNETNKARYSGYAVPVMASIAFKLAA